MRVASERELTARERGRGEHSTALEPLGYNLAMASKRTKTRPARAPVASDVDSQLATLEHPHRDAIVRICELLRSADPRVTGAVKWGAPSFAVDEHFATFQLRAKQGVMLVMHFGAKKREVLPERASIPDPTGLLTWVAEDRAVVGFADLADVEAKASPFVTVVRAWIAAIPAA